MQHQQYDPVALNALACLFIMLAIVTAWIAIYLPEDRGRRKPRKPDAK